MSNSFQRYFRCPEDYVSFSGPGKLGGVPGFFQFQRDTVCYGKLSDGQQSPDFRHDLPDISGRARILDGSISLPFDLEEAASSLRMEAYAGHMRERHTRLGANSLVRKIYYWTRPLLPVPVRSVLQRIKLRGELKNAFPRWPVDRSVDLLFEKSMIAAIRAKNGKPVPFIWFWPEGKRSAFILTHDVEATDGKNFCSSLMDIDEEYGFKASFQIVPEKRYSVEADFLESFRKRQFDICVHDLNHDGNLYLEREEFRRRAKQINRYCKEFRTGGFRSGVLYRNLLWYEDFTFSFDMSVPNVAHLDPQGGGCCTVMPYFVGDILEIPVTATQDYSLFHILHQHSIDLWKDQIRRIVDGHGLISFIIHPDYVIDPVNQQTFRELLSYLREQCVVQDIWTTVPSELNKWWRQRDQMKLQYDAGEWKIMGEGSGSARVAYASLEGEQLVYSFSPARGVDPPHVYATVGKYERMGEESDRYSPGHKSLATTSSRSDGEAIATLEAPASIEEGQSPNPPGVTRHRPLRVAMVSYSFYETDNRVLRYAMTLAKRGDHVDVFALRREGKAAFEVIGGVNVHRLQGRLLNEKNQLSYAWRIVQFLFRAMFEVSKLELKEHYDLMHIHSVPDFMVFSGLLPKLRGTPIILDIHDILPEFYASKFSAGKQSGLFHALVGVEHASSNFADHVIIANDIWRERLISRGLASEKCTVVLNAPDRSIFTKRGVSPRTDGKFIIIYPGSLNWHQGLDIAIKAFARISKRVPQAEFHIYGDGPSKPDLIQLAKDLGVEDQVKMPKAKPIQEIAGVMELANLGIVPKRKDNFGNEAFSTKILEFMAMGVPVIVSDTMVDKLYFDDSVVTFFESGNEEQLANRILEMIENPERRKQQIRNADQFITTMDWNVKQHEYLELVKNLTSSSAE